MRKDRLREIHTLSVIMSAEELFEAKGYEATSIDDIAYRTGISKSTLYVYFKSKQIIWDSIVCKYMEELLVIAKKAAEGKGSFEKRYFKLCFDIADQFGQHPLFYRATLGTISMDMDQEIYKKIYDVGEQTNEAIAAFIRSGIEEGVVRKDIDIYPAVIMMWSSISGIISMALDKEEYLKLRFNMTKKEYLKKAFKMLLEGLS
ncbi:MAG: TetR/AcrR family transcriptional regulator [Clostridiales bacterium]|nr:TetR/AcrR family transcriptional regulator [Clostridiales bacterium]